MKTTTKGIISHGYKSTIRLLLKLFDYLRTNVSNFKKSIVLSISFYYFNDINFVLYIEKYNSFLVSKDV